MQKKLLPKSKAGNGYYVENYQRNDILYNTPICYLVVQL